MRLLFLLLCGPRRGVTAGEVLERERAGGILEGCGRCVRAEHAESVRSGVAEAGEHEDREGGGEMALRAEMAGE